MMSPVSFSLRGGIVNEYSFLLEKIIEDIEVPKWLYDRAEERYNSVSDWLSREESNLLLYEPYIYVQGSFLLGTANRPIDTEEGYDIDLVCCLNTPLDSISWDELKQIVGNEIKANGKYKQMLKQEGRRCWTIVYSEKEKVQFHLDILPAIPNTYLKQENNPLLQNPILITDNIQKRFLGSNPKGYLEWFKIQMMTHKSFYEDRVQFMAKQLNCETEAVPTYVVKTPLQMVVQLLKRHRDIVYKDLPNELSDTKPISIIITTLAAKAYSSISSFVSNDLYSIAMAILEEMPKHIIQKNNIDSKPVFWVENPTDKTENFADKWEQYPMKGIMFKFWLDEAKNSLDKAFKKQGIHNVSESLKEMFGDKSVSRALTKFHEDLVGNARSKGGLGISGTTARLVQLNERSKASKIPKNTFYGGREIKFSKRKSALNMAVQGLRLQNFRTISSKVNHNKLVWVGNIKPTQLSEIYTIEIIYKKGRAPQVFVRDPKLKVLGGKLPPHIYSKKNLCLFYPPNNEWDSTKLISKTIIPWTSLWLFYYEIWLSTGEWLGGGYHPAKKK